MKFDEQQAVYDFFFTEKKAKLDLKLTSRIRELSKSSEVTISVLKQLVKTDEPVHKKKSSFTIKRNRFKEYADILPDDNELERLFFEFLQNYKMQRAL